MRERGKTILRGLQYKREVKKVTNLDGKNQYSEVKVQNEPQPKNTAEKLFPKYKRIKVASYNYFL